MQGGEMREIEWVSPKELPATLSPAQDTPDEYGPWQWAADAGRGRGRMTGKVFTLQENGTLRCPAGATLWFSELRQENAFTKAGRLRRLAGRLSGVSAP
jgi:hypothetical protein